MTILELEAKIRNAYDKIEIYNGRSKEVININYSLRDAKKAISKIKLRITQINEIVEDQIKEIDRIKNEQPIRFQKGN